MKANNFTGIILAGGKSSRMGTEKGFLEYDGKSYTAMLLDTLKSQFDDVIIIANDEAYEKFGIPVYKDLIKDQGPLAGLYTGLSVSKTDYNFFIPCDTPFLSQRLITVLIQHAEKSDVDGIIPSYNGRKFPLTAIYHKNCMAQFEDALHNNRLKVKQEIEHVNHVLVDFDISYEKDFINFNTPADINVYNNMK